MADPSTDTWRATFAASGMPTSAQLRQAQRDLAASQQDLTHRDATIVELLGILDAFQVASGADRNACLQDGIDAVWQLRAENRRLKAELDSALGRLNEQRDKGGERHG